MALRGEDLEKFLGMIVILNIKYDFGKYIGVLNKENERVVRLEPCMKYERFSDFYTFRGGYEKGALDILKEKGTKKIISIAAVEITRFYKL